MSSSKDDLRIILTALEKPRARKSLISDDGLYALESAAPPYCTAGSWELIRVLLLQKLDEAGDRFCRLI